MSECSQQTFRSLLDLKTQWNVSSKTSKLCHTCAPRQAHYNHLEASLSTCLYFDPYHCNLLEANECPKQISWLFLEDLNMEIKIKIVNSNSKWRSRISNSRVLGKNFKWKNTNSFNHGGKFYCGAIHKWYHLKTESREKLEKMSFWGWTSMQNKCFKERRVVKKEIKLTTWKLSRNLKMTDF